MSNKPFKHWIECRALGFLLVLTRLIPRASESALGWALARLWYFVVPVRRGVVCNNLSDSFPDKSPRWVRRVVIDCASHFARACLEMRRVLGGPPDQLAEMVEGVEGFEQLRDLNRDGRPVFCVTGHLGNWELMAAYFASVHQLPLTVLAKPMHNRALERRLNRARHEAGYEVVDSTGEIAPLLRAAQRGRVIAFVADQDARHHGVFVPFFDRPASTYQGPALLAYRLDVPIIVASCFRNPRTGRYRVAFHEPLRADRTRPIREEILRLTAEHTALLEREIRQAPEQYFWFHRRWKTQPNRVKKKPTTLEPETTTPSTSTAA